MTTVYFIKQNGDMFVREIGAVPRMGDEVLYHEYDEDTGQTVGRLYPVDCVQWAMGELAKTCTITVRLGDSR